MCEDHNSSIIAGSVPRECRFCLSESSCNQFKHSFTHRCRWEFLPGRVDYWGVRDGLCTDGLDFPTVAASPWIMMTGWALLVFLIGLIRRERGHYTMLRRHGVNARADVVGYWVETGLIKTDKTLPSVGIERYFVLARWPIQAYRRSSPGSSVRCEAVSFSFRALCNRWRGVTQPLSPWEGSYSRVQPSLDVRKEDPANQLCVERTPIDRVEDQADTYTSFAGMIPTATSHFNHAEAVQMTIQCSQEEWKVATHQKSLRIVYDPFVRESAMPVAAVQGQPMSISLLYILAVMCGWNIIMMGLVMIVDAFHCGHHFWGFPPCCADCSDWIDGAGTYGQKCFRGACDGLAARTHWYWCESECEVR